MDYKERMECANSWFNGGSKLSLKQKERLICIWDDEKRLEQDTNYCVTDCNHIFCFSKKI